MKWYRGIWSGGSVRSKSDLAPYIPSQEEKLHNLQEQDGIADGVESIAEIKS